MDWKALLKKYMDYVDTVEGTHFVNSSMTPVEFTDVEWAALRVIGEEVNRGT